VIGFYLDENVEGQITRGLRARGVDVLTAEEDGYDAMPDPQVLDRAGGLGRVAFSRDQDFLREAARRQQTGERFVGVVYAHKTQVRIGQCVAELELLAQAGAPDDFANRVYFLPL
jgi:predicted nuclease of predicted toxin-antitoxin system